MFGEVTRHQAHRIAGDERASSAAFQIREEGHDQKALFGRIEKVAREVGVLVPLVPWPDLRGRRSPFPLGFQTKVDDEGVAPSTRLANAPFASHELASGFPSAWRDL